MPEISAPTEADYSQLIIAESTPADPAPVKTPEPEPVAEVSPEPEPETVEETAPAPVAETDSVSKGTPDKWRQRVDQRMTEIEQLVAKKESGTITLKEETRLEVKKDELADILEKGELADPLTAKRVLEVERRSSDDVSALKMQIEKLETQQRETDRRQIWRDEREKYPGVDVEKTVWPNAVADATKQVQKENELAGMTDQFDTETVRKMCYARARVLYEQRATDALKSVKARGIPSKQTAPSTPSKPTPNGARVSVAGSAAGVPKAANPNEITDADYGNLIIHD